MHGLTNGHHLHSYVLLFLCLYYLFATCFVFLKNAVLALQILCMMDMWQDRRELAYAWTGGWTSSAFLCSFVLMSLFRAHTDYVGMRSLVLARDDGSLAVCKMASCKVKCEAGFTR